MRPLMLEIEGLQSFKERQIVDFEKLTEHGLFGIFGETGSGKSTILDALTLALYGDVVRIKGSRGDTLIDLLNIGSTKMRVSYEFLIGDDRYKAERSFSKNKNKREFSKREAKFIINGEIVADRMSDVDREIEEIIGLSMDDFTRSVVLPQGKFGEFLKLTGTEKRSMLERIFGLEEYGRKLVEKLSWQRSGKKQEAEAIRNKMAGKGAVTEEELEEKREKETLLKSQLKESKKKLVELLKEFSEKEKVYRLSEEKKGLMKDETQLDSLKEEEGEKENKVAQGEKASQVMEVFYKVQKKEKEAEGFEINLKTIDREIESEKGILSSYSEELTALRSEENKLSEKERGLFVDPEKRELINWGVSQGKKLSELQENGKKNSEKIRGTRENIEKLSECIEGNSIKIAEAKKELESLEAEDEERINEIGIEITGLTVEVERVKDTEKNIRVLEAEFEKGKEKLDSLNKKLAAKEEELKKATGKREAYLASHLAEGLREGEPCPVCGSKDHPHLAVKSGESGTDEEEIRGIEGGRAALKEEIYGINLDRISRELEEKRELLNERSSEKISERISELNKELEELQKRNLEISEKRKLLTDKLNKWSSEKLVLEERKQNSIENLEGLIKIKDEIGENIESIKNELKEKFPLYVDETFSTESLNKRQKEILLMEKEQLKLKKEIEKIRKLYSEKMSEAEKIQDRLRVKELEKSALKGALDQVRVQVDIERTEAEKKLESFGFISRDEAEEMCLSQEELDTLKEWLGDYREKLMKNKLSLAEVERKLKGREITPEEWETVKEKKILVEEEITNLEKEHTLIIRDVEEAEKLIKELGEMSEKLREKEKELNLLEDLSNLFKGNTFVEYLAVSRLRSIVSNASTRLDRITNGKYSLAVDEEANFLVVDNFNGGERRRSSTLSGGETFLVSLSLALALSNQIQLKGRSQLEFFFLDEGFGTLDLSLLDRVITSLETLKNQEKLKVGIITHVEEIKERVPRKLLVYPALPGERGTEVELA